MHVVGLRVGNNCCLTHFRHVGFLVSRSTASCRNSKQKAQLPSTRVEAVDPEVVYEVGGRGELRVSFRVGLGDDLDNAGISGSLASASNATTKGIDPR